ncbi:MAG: rRNA maturation RNase YbeY [Patescibacteria group bacterium]
MVYRHVRESGFSEKRVQAIVAYALRRLKKTGDVSIHFIGEKRMKHLNTLHRGRGRPTDVLSFPAGNDLISNEQHDIGDIFLCVPYIKKQARRFGVSYEEELSRMMIHGLLHCLGYDHGTKRDADVMFPLQESIVQKVL